MDVDAGKTLIRAFNLAYGELIARARAGEHRIDCVLAEQKCIVVYDPDKDQITQIIPYYED